MSEVVFVPSSPPSNLCPTLEGCYQMTELEEDRWQRTCPSGSLAWEVSRLPLRRADRNLAGRELQIEWLVSSADLASEIAPSQRNKAALHRMRMTSHVTCPLVWNICRIDVAPLRFEAHLPEMIMRLGGKFKCLTHCDFEHIFLCIWNMSFCFA